MSHGKDEFVAGSEELEIPAEMSIVSICARGGQSEFIIRPSGGRERKYNNTGVLQNHCDYSPTTV